MNFFAQLKERITKIIEIQLKLLKLNIISSLSSLLSYLIFIIICLFLVFSTFIFATMGVSEMLTEYGYSKSVSFFLVTGGYLVILFLILMFRKNFTKSIANGFVKNLTDSNTDTEVK